MKPLAFWAVVAVVLLTVFFLSPFPLPYFKMIAAAVTVCMHLYFLQALEQQEQGRGGLPL